MREVKVTIEFDGKTYGTTARYTDAVAGFLGDRGMVERAAIGLATKMDEEGAFKAKGSVPLLSDGDDFKTEPPKDV